MMNAYCHHWYQNGQKYYKYRIDSVMGDPNNLDYRVRFIPRTKSDQLVGGYMVVSSNVWSVREIRFREDRS